MFLKILKFKKCILFGSLRGVFFTTKQSMRYPKIASQKTLAMTPNVKFLFSFFLTHILALSCFAQTEASPKIIQEQVDTVKHLVNLILESMVKYGFQVLGGIVVLIIGWIIAGFVANFVKKFLGQKHIDVTVAKFLVSVSKLIVMCFAGLIALGKFGIEIAPFIAGFSVIGFATSFALQGPLSNYAAGATLIFTKPFRVNDIIEVNGFMGEVEDITLPRTILITVDGTKIIIPNKHIIGEVIHNFTELKKLEIKVGIGYGANVDLAIETISKIVQMDKRVSQERKPRVGVAEFGDSSVNIMGRMWCPQKYYFEVLFDVNKKILEEFTRLNIEIPFPQQVVHMKSNS